MNINIILILDLWSHEGFLKKGLFAARLKLALAQIRTHKVEKKHKDLGLNTSGKSSNSCSVNYPLSLCYHQTKRT